MYRFKWDQELAWGAATAAVLAVAQLAVTNFDPNAITDWRVYGLSLLGAAVRATAGFLLSLPKTTPAEPQS